MAHSTTFIDLRFPEQLDAVSFDKGGEEFLSIAGADIGLVDNLTVTAWIKPRHDTLIVGCIYAHRGTSPDHVSANEGSLEIRRTLGARRVDFVYLDNNEATVQNQQFGGFLRKGIWQMLTFSWNGEVGGVKLYQNGTEYTANHTNATDLTKTGAGDDILDDSKTISIGGRISGSNDEFDGDIHSVMMWNKQLAALEVAAVYNSGDGAGFNPERNLGDYVSRSNLLYWYRLSLDTTDDVTMGQNYGKNGSIGDLDGNSFSAADVVTDAPRGVETLDGVATEFTRTTDDYLASPTPTSGGFGNTFTWSCWIKTTLAGVSSEFPRPMHFDSALNASPNNSSCSILFDEFERYTITMRDTTGTLFKQYIGPVESLNAWSHYCWTWDGTDLLVYRNSVNITESTVNKFVDIAGTRAEIVGSWRFGALGSNRWAGKVYSPAVWSSVLTSGEVTDIYNADHLDSYGVNYATYASAGDLVHYWDFRLADNRFKDRVGDQDLSVSTVTPADSDIPDPP